MRASLHHDGWKNSPTVARFKKWLWLLLCMLVAAPASALGHGGGTQQLANAPAGPYRVFVWTNPDPWRVGSTHTTVALTQPLGDGKDATVTGATIIIAMSPKSNLGAVQRVQAIEGDGARAGFYEADGEVSAVGPWQVAVEITGPQGQGATTFEMTVEPAETINPLWWAIGSVIVVIFVAGGWWMLSRSQHRPARRTK